MPKLTVDAPKARLVRAFGLLGFEIVREREAHLDGEAHCGRSITR